MSALIETKGLTRILPAAVPVTLVQDITLAIGMEISNAEKIPSYKETDEFSAADKKRFVK